MSKDVMLRLLLLMLLAVPLCMSKGIAQRRRTNTTLNDLTNDAPGMPTDAQGRIVGRGQSGQGNSKDSLKHRDNSEDSITIFYRYFDSSRTRVLDSSVSDFTRRYPFPNQYIHLGNFGTAARSLVFNPILTSGFDAGFHAFDVYRFRIADTRFFQTTRPFTELGYLIGGKGEQMINVLHTQNIRPNFNMALQYRLINSAGEFNNQNTNHSSYRLNGNYQSRNKRYTVYGIYMVNNLNASANGGIQRDTLMNDYRYTNRLLIPTRLAGESNFVRNPFNSKVSTGNVQNEKTFLLRQQYDFGQSDSVMVKDSVVSRLFYPRFRLQHTFTYSSQQFEFRDYFIGSGKLAAYQNYFGYRDTIVADSVIYRDGWKNVQNNVSIISFPEKNNLNQFIKVGATHQLLKGTFTDTMVRTRDEHNIFLNAEYRNRTRNQKWDLEAAGNLYVNGLNSGDYSVQAALKRFISKKLGYLELGFHNVNRTPGYIYSNQTAYDFVRPASVKKENITHLSASFSNEAAGFGLSGDYYLMSNYAYFDSFFHASQEATLFNVLHLSARQHWKFTKSLNLYSEVHLQKTTGNAPVQLPLFFTINRIAFEGVYAKNMNYAFGFEVRYFTPYKADNFSPFLGQFFYQNNYTVRNRPDVNLYFNFRIKRFTGFIRAENLNTLSRNTGSLGFNKNNYAAQYYPQQGLWIRYGFWWTFIN